MKSPNPTLMNAYQTSDVFFKKTAGVRVSDEVNGVIARQFFDKLAAGIAPMPLKVPAMASGIRSKPGTVAAMPMATARMTPPNGATHSPQVLQKLYSENPAKAPGSPERQALQAKLQGQTPAPAMSKNTTPGLATLAGQPAQAPRAQTQMASPLGAMPTPAASGGAAPNVAQFSKPQKPGLMERVVGKKDPGTGAPTINPMAGADAPAAANKPVANAPAAAVEAAPKKGGGLPWNRMLLTGGALGAGYLGLKALQSGLGFLGGGHGGPAGYGSSPGGYMPPMGVNAYGQPQLGTGLM